MKYSGNLNTMKDCVIKKTRDSYIIWFSPSQTFVLLKGPAYKCIRLIAEGAGDEIIISELIKKSNSPQTEIKNFVEDLRKRYNFLMNPANRAYNSPIVSLPDDFLINPFKVKTYQISNHCFSISYGSSEIYNQINPLIESLSVEKREKADAGFEVFEKDNILFLRENLKLTECFESTNIHYLKAEVLKRISGLVHSVKNNNWMASFHASAITDGKNVILFSAKPGNGKSTVATLLQTKGYRLLSDDFIMVENKSQCVCPIPLAISIKQGSLDVLSPYYPELKKQQPVFTSNNKKVYYLNPSISQVTSLPVKAVIFVKYDKETQLNSEEPETDESIRNLLSETWVNPTKTNVSKFLDWAIGLKFYNISYSNLSLLSDEINKIFLL